MNFAYYFHWLILIALVLVYVKVAADEFLDCGKFKKYVSSTVKFRRFSNKTFYTQHCSITKRITLLESYSGLKPISNNCKHPIIIANCITYEKETYTKVVTKVRFFYYICPMAPIKLLTYVFIGGPVRMLHWLRIY